MIKFFRHIRKSLIEKNQMGKYFKYAVGEILLVVIGILIALQINNWNEDRKLQAQEIKMLKELRKDVAFSVKELDTVAHYNQITVNYLKQIQRHLNEDLPYSQVLDTAFAHLDLFHIPYLPKTSYETLKVKGMDRISNDSLKAKIIQIYDFEFQRIIDDYGGWEWSFSQNTTQRMMIGHIRRANNMDDETARPNDYEALKENPEFRNFLNVLITLRSDHVRALQWGRKNVNDLLQLLDKELEQK
ncbi:DUF6090 family protein [Winogradskyella sp. 3972H.M.0a.05]|uniref:DUF6090 family protein n=1 Tax=Winogradskyella sp. 3972H.M.0a.05 TaxID=2950277 RepID=UPI0033938413